MDKINNNGVELASARSTSSSISLRKSADGQASAVGAAGDAVNGLGIGSLVGDSKLDIAVGTSGGKVYVFSNDSSWTGSAVDTAVGSQVNGLVVGDIDGDGDDDVVIGCNGGYVYYYENIDPSSGLWTETVVDYIAVVVYAVDVGDVSG